MKTAMLIAVCLCTLVLPAATEAQSTSTLYFGPVTFTRSAGKPRVETISIATELLAHFQGPFTLHVKNGADNGRHRASSALVSIGGPGQPVQVIFRPSDFSQHVRELTTEVAITRGSVLSVQMNSTIGSYLSIWIEAPLLPGRARIGSEGGMVMSADGAATLDVPTGAVETDVIFSVEPYSGATDPQGIAGTAYDVGPDGVAFNRPAVLTVTFDPARVSTPGNLEMRTLVAGEWVRVEGSAPVVGQNAVSAPLSHLSPYLLASTEFDSVDVVLFETLQWLADQEQQFSLWAEPGLAREYTVSQTPVYFVRRDNTGAAIKAYLVSFPSPPAGAVQVQHPYRGVGLVYRYDAEMAELIPQQLFDFALDLSGRPTFAIAYTPADMNRTPLTNTTIPYTPLDVWTGLFVHELFHHYQFDDPNADWVSSSFGGLRLENYPVTPANIALSLLERRAMLAGRAAATQPDKEEALRRVLAIRKTRAQLPEATGKCVSVRPKTHGQGVFAPDGVGQSFTACESGGISFIRLDVISFDNQNARLELKSESDPWPAAYSQNITLSVGVNVIQLNVPFSIQTGMRYAIGIFPSSGFLGLWSDADSYPGGEAFFVVNSSDVGITPSTDLAFALTLNGPNYIDRMDRYQERVEGSAHHVSRRVFVLSGTMPYAQELLEQLDRTTWTHYQTSAGELMSTFFRGGWYETGSTILDLVDEVTASSWRTTFPSGGSPIDVVEMLYGPLSQAQIDALVNSAKQAYDWPAILNQVNAIAASYLDRIP